jgi:hypothetical protein
MVGIVLETLVMGSWLVITSSLIARRHCPSNHLKLKLKTGSPLRFAVAVEGPLLLRRMQVINRSTWIQIH